MKISIYRTQKHEYHQSRLEFGKDANIKILEYDHNRTNTMILKSAKRTLIIEVNKTLSLHALEATQTPRKINYKTTAKPLKMPNSILYQQIAAQT